MKKVSLFLSAIVMAAMMLSSFGSGVSNEESESNEVTIGNQVWMAENLNVDKFRNGDPIPEAKSNEEWEAAGVNKQPAWCYYDNDSANGAKYGKLYNWYAVNDSRGLAPVGYHVPSDAEWSTMINFLDPAADGGENPNMAGGMMKTTGTIEDSAGLWYSPNTAATNSSGFSGLPGGKRNIVGTFSGIGKGAFWWSSSESFTKYAWFRVLNSSTGKIYSTTLVKEIGGYVRCLRD